MIVTPSGRRSSEPVPVPSSTTARFEANGAVGLGLPAEHRAYELFESKDVSIERLLDSKLYADGKSNRYDNFYGRSWLLFHYLFIDDARRTPRGSR